MHSKIESWIFNFRLKIGLKELIEKNECVSCRYFEAFYLRYAVNILDWNLRAVHIFAMFCMLKTSWSNRMNWKKNEMNSFDWNSLFLKKQMRKFGR